MSIIFDGDLNEYWVTCFCDRFDVLDDDEKTLQTVALKNLNTLHDYIEQNIMDLEEISANLLRAIMNTLDLDYIRTEIMDKLDFSEDDITSAVNSTD